MHTMNDQATHHRAYEDSEITEPDSLTLPLHWAVCFLDWQAHAVDAWADHPLSLWIARCGHHLSGATPLSELTQETQCPSCAEWSPTTESHTRVNQ
jgi:hypothetical protein